MPNDSTAVSSVAAVRDAERSGRTSAPEGSVIDDRAVQLPGGLLRLRRYRPDAADGARAGIIFFHGGGFVAGDADSHDALCGRISLAAGCVVVSSSYRLAPEHRFPCALDDAYFAACYVHEHADELGFDHRRFGVAGIEVGAGLATNVARLAKERRNPALGYQLLIRPWLDLRGEDPRIELYAEARLREDPRCSPILARNLIGLPPVWIACDQGDAFRTQADLYVERLREAHVAVEIGEDVGSDEALRACGRAIERALGGS